MRYLPIVGVLTTVGDSWHPQFREADRSTVQQNITKAAIYVVFRAARLKTVV